MEAREQMNIVIVGHVDHGKSTVIVELLADTGSLPEGKLESVKEFCRKNARPFEYAFLLEPGLFSCQCLSEIFSTPCYCILMYASGCHSA